MKLIEQAIGQWKKRLRPSVKAKARHFEHLLDKKWLIVEPPPYITGYF